MFWEPISQVEVLKLWYQLWGTLCSSGRNWEFWVSSQLCVTAPGVGFMVNLYLSLCYPFWCGFFSRLPLCRIHSASFWISLRRNYSLCRGRFCVSVGGDEFRRLLHCHLKPEIHVMDSYKKCYITNIFDVTDTDVVWKYMDISYWFQKWFRNVGLNEKF